MQKSAIPDTVAISDAELEKEGDFKQNKNIDMQSELRTEEDDTELWRKRRDQMRSPLHSTR